MCVYRWIRWRMLWIPHLARLIDFICTATSHSFSHDQWLHEVPWSSRGLMLFTVNASKRSWIIMFLLREWEINQWGKIRDPAEFSPASREWESVGVQLRPLDNAAYIARLLSQGSKWLNGKTVCSIQKVLDVNPNWILDFFPRIYSSLSQ